MSRPFTARLACPMRLESYPFDTQHCSFTIGSWMYSSQQVDTDARSAPPSFWRHPDRQDVDVPADEGAAARVPPSAPVDLSHYFPVLGGSEFDLTGIRAVTQHRRYGCCADSFSIVVIELDGLRHIGTGRCGRPTASSRWPYTCVMLVVVIREDLYRIVGAGGCRSSTVLCRQSCAVSAIRSRASRRCRD